MTTTDTDVSDLLAQRADLLADAAQRAQRYLAGLDSPPGRPGRRRPCRPGPRSTSRCPPPGGPGRRARAARRGRLAGHRGQRRAALLRLRDRRRAARRAGRRLADRGLGPERGAHRDVAGRRAAGRGSAALGDRPARPAPGHRRRLRHRRHHGQRHLPGRGPGRGAQPARLGRGGPGPGRRAPGHRGGRRAGAHHRAQGARPDRPRPGPRGRAARRCPGPHRAPCPARYLRRPGAGLPAGGQREQRGQRPLRGPRPVGSCAGGVGARGRRVRAVGGGRARPARTRWPGWPRRTPGPPTRTSG